MRPITVTVCHDAAEGVWFVESSDIPGLNVEAPSYERLVEIAVDLASDLIGANIENAIDDLRSMPLSFSIAPLHSSLEFNPIVSTPLESCI